MAGAGVGLIMWPLKWARSWKWENFWLPYAILSLIVFLLDYLLRLLPHLGTVYESVPAQELMRPLLMGTAWGIAQLGAGIRVHRLTGTTFLGTLGISIGFAVFMITMILSGRPAGLMTGEWRFTKPQTLRSFTLGVTMLVADVIIIGIARYFSQ